MKSKKLWSVLLAVMIVVSVLSFSACSTSTPAASSSAPAASSAAATSAAPAVSASESATESASAAASAGASDVSAKLNALSGVPTFKAPGEAFDAATKMQGVKFMTIPASSGNPFNQITCDLMSTVAKEIGFIITPYKNQGNVTEWQQGIGSAKSLGDSLVDLFAGPTPSSLSAQIKSAQSQGVKVVSSSLVDVADKMDYVDANLGNDYVLGGQLEADWAISKQGDKTNALVVVAEEIPSTQDMEKGIKDEFAKYAPNAKYKFMNVPLTDWSTKIQPQVQNALLADPTINYVIAIYDSMTQYIVPAVDITGNSGKVKIIGFNGTPFALDYVKQGKVEMDIGQSLDWIARAVVDYEMRVHLGMTQPENENIGIRIWTADNINEAMGADGKAAYSTGYGDSYQDSYRQLWGIKK